VSVVVIATTPDMTAEQYDQSVHSFQQEGQLPAGCTAHIAGPSPEGWRVITVWDSAEQAAAFGRDVLGPKLQQLGVAPTAPVIYPAHNVIR
jgi:hypothetical protein